MSTTPRPIRNALRRAGIKPQSHGYGYLFQTPSFFIRVLESDPAKSMLQEGEKRWTIQFAYRPKFDKWSNSTNFETEVWYHPEKNKRFLDGHRRAQWTIPDFALELKWVKIVAESGLFDWNSYFTTITTPWFINSHRNDYRKAAWWGKKRRREVRNSLAISQILAQHSPI